MALILEILQAIRLMLVVKHSERWGNEIYNRGTFAIYCLHWLVSNSYICAFAFGDRNIVREDGSVDMELLKNEAKRKSFMGKLLMNLGIGTSMAVS